MGVVQSTRQFLRQTKFNSDLIKGKNTPSNSATESTTTKGVTQDVTCTRTGAGNSKVALPIVPVKVYNRVNKKCVYTFAFLYNGSTNTFYATDLDDMLDLKGPKEELTLTTLEKENSKITVNTVDLSLSDKYEQNFIKLNNVHSRPMSFEAEYEVTQEDVDSWLHLQGLDYFAQVNGPKGSPSGRTGCT